MHSGICKTWFFPKACNAYLINISQGWVLRFPVRRPKKVGWDHFPISFAVSLNMSKQITEIHISKPVFNCFSKPFQRQCNCLQLHLQFSQEVLNSTQLWTKSAIAAPYSVSVVCITLFPPDLLHSTLHPALTSKAVEVLWSSLFFPSLLTSLRVPCRHVLVHDKTHCLATLNFIHPNLLHSYSQLWSTTPWFTQEEICKSF